MKAAAESETNTEQPEIPLLPLSFEEAMARDTSAVIIPTPKKPEVQIVIISIHMQYAS